MSDYDRNAGVLVDEYGSWQTVEVTKRPARELEFEADTEFEIMLTNFMGHSNQALVELVARFDDQVWEVVGAARRDREDVPDQQVGLLIALGNALQQLTNHVRRQAEGRMKHNADVMEHREAMRAERSRRASNRPLFEAGNVKLEAMKPRKTAAKRATPTKRPARKATARA